MSPSFFETIHIYLLENLAATAPGTAALQSLVGASAGDALGSAGSGLETYPKTVATLFTNKKYQIRRRNLY